MLPTCFESRSIGACSLVSPGFSTQRSNCTVNEQVALNPDPIGATRSTTMLTEKVVYVKCYFHYTLPQTGVNKKMRLWFFHSQRPLHGPNPELTGDRHRDPVKSGVHAQLDIRLKPATGLTLSGTEFRKFAKIPVSGGQNHRHLGLYPHRLSADAAEPWQIFVSSW